MNNPATTEVASVMSTEAEHTYIVEGMSCGHCLEAVTEEVQRIPGVEVLGVDLDGGTLRVRGEAHEAAIRAAVEEAGYELASRQP